MRVICVNNIYDRPTSMDQFNLDLTIGKIYDVFAVDKLHDEWGYKITNDRGYTCHYSHGRFVIPLDEYRHKQLEILEHEI